MSKDSIIFTTNAIDAIGDKSAIPAQIITARPKDEPKTKDDWWTFELLREGILSEVYIAIADGLDVKETMREEAEYLLQETGDRRQNVGDRM